MDFDSGRIFCYFRGIMEVNFLKHCISTCFLFIACLISLDCLVGVGLALLP